MFEPTYRKRHRLRRLIALLFGSSLGHGLIVVGHMLMLGLGMVALARRLGLSALGGAIAGVVVVLIGSTQTKTVQFEQIQPLAWLPLLLLALHADHRRTSCDHR